MSTLGKRGLHGLKIVTSDAHEGLIHGIGKVFPETPWQRCQTHFSRNVLDHAPKKYQTAIHDKLLDIYHCKTMEEARKKRDEIIEEYRDVAEKAMECLENGFENAMTVLAIPESMRRYFRTSNHLERLNKELKRRSNVIRIFSNEASLLRLMGSVLCEQNDNYTAHSKTNFKTEDVEKLMEASDALRKIAREQQALQAA